MIAALLITLREGLEAALIVGLALNGLGVAFEGRGEEVFEGAAMLVAAGVLTWMIFWMQRQGRQIQTELESDVRRAVTTGSRWALFSLAFVAVVREGIETVLFLTAAAFSATPTQTLVGSGLGLAIATLLGWLMLAMGKRLDVQAYFRVTGILLILFAAGLVAHGLHELQEAALLPIFIEHVWDVNPILDENGTVGSLLKALFGYNGNPSLLEVVAYVAYFMIVGAASLRRMPRTLVPVAGTNPSQ